MNKTFSRAGIAAIAALFLFPAASSAVYVNTYTDRGVKWNLEADKAEGSVAWVLANPPPNGSVSFTDDTQKLIYYNMTLTGYSYTGGGGSRDIEIPGVIGWDTRGSLGVGYGPLQFIASSAFSGKNLTSVKIPFQILGINLPCFRNCPYLVSIEVDDINQYYSSENGILYNKNKTSLIKYPEGKSGNHFEVSANVKSLQSGCLAGTKLKVVRFLGNKPSCGNGVFQNSSFVGYCPESWGMGWGARWNGITMYPLPENGIRVVAGVTNHYELIDGVLWCATGSGEVSLVTGDWLQEASVPATVGGQAVTGIGDISVAANLAKITIPAGVTAISAEASWAEGKAFWGLEKLTEIVVDSANEAFESEGGVLFSKGKQSLVCIPRGKTGAYAVPAGVRKIGEAAAAGGRLSSVSIPGSVERIEYNAFSVCQSLRNVSIANGVRVIDSDAFRGCPLTEVAIPASVEEIAEGMSSPSWECPLLTNMTVDAANATYSSADGAVLTKDGRTLLFVPQGKTGAYMVPDGVRTIGERAFCGCSNLVGVSFGNLVRTIGDWAFEDCSSLVSMEIPYGTKHVGYCAFGCPALEELFVPDTVQTFGEDLEFRGRYLGFEALQVLSVPGAWEGTDMLEDCELPEGCEVVYRERRPDGGATPVWRFYSKNYKGHFFTISEGEKESLRATNPNWKFEGGAYLAHTEEAEGTTALYRFYSKGYKGHFFTIDAEEAEEVKKNHNWKYEGIAYYVYPEAVEGSVPVYRFWSKAYRHHFYTIDPAETDELIDGNPKWKYEMVAFWALPMAEPGAKAKAGKAMEAVGPADGEGGSAGDGGGEEVVSQASLLRPRPQRAILPQAGTRTMGGGVVVTTCDGTDGSAAADGDERTGWSPDGAGAGWVALSFAEPVEVAGVEVVGEMPEGWRVLLSEDAEKWREGETGTARYVWVAWAEGAPLVREIRLDGEP